MLLLILLLLLWSLIVFTILYLLRVYLIFCLLDLLKILLFLCVVLILPLLLIKGLFTKFLFGDSEWKKIILIFFYLSIIILTIKNFIYVWFDISHKDIMKIWYIGIPFISVMIFFRSIIKDLFEAYKNHLLGLTILTIYCSYLSLLVIIYYWYL